MEKKNLLGMWFRNLNKRDLFEDVVIDGRILLKWIHKFDESKHN